MLAHAYVMPPQPQVELDDMDIEKISWILLDKLEAQGYNIVLAKRKPNSPNQNAVGLINPKLGESASKLNLSRLTKLASTKLAVNPYGLPQW